MRFVLAFCLAVAALVAIAASMAMNYAFWTAQGLDAGTARVLGAVSIMIDVFKALLPLAIAGAWLERSRVGAIVASLLFCGCLVFSFMSALGFAAWTRGATAESRAAQSIVYEAKEKDLGRVNEQLATVSHVRPTPVVVASIDRAKQGKRWPNSNQCKEATVPASRGFCAAFADLRVELASALERDKLEARGTSLQSDIDGLVRTGARLDGDLQAGVLSKLLGVRLLRVQKGLILLMALVVELAAGFGLFLAALPLRSHKPRLDVNADRDRSRLALAKRLTAAKAATRPTRLVRGSEGQLMIE